MKKLRISIGIFAYNEEKNIQQLLDSITQQKLKQTQITEILVISSGSTDQTNQILRKIAKKNKKLKLISQKKRLGKASAINLFLDCAKENIVITSSADILLSKNAIEEIIKPLNKANVGIVGSRPIPVNNPNTFFGFAAHLLWDLHHSISLRSPKMGEFIAFRKVFKKIPVLSGVDEANIEALIRGQGYKAIYQPRAVIYNKGAENQKDFITRRRYIYAGHLATKHEYSYEVSTLNGITIATLLIQNFQFSWRFILWTPAVICLELYSRFLGIVDYNKYKQKAQPIWKIAPTTKNLN